MKKDGKKLKLLYLPVAVAFGFLEAIALICLQLKNYGSFSGDVKLIIAGTTGLVAALGVAGLVRLFKKGIALDSTNYRLERFSLLPIIVFAPFVLSILFSIQRFFTKTFLFKDDFRIALFNGAIALALTLFILALMYKGTYRWIPALRLDLFFKRGDNQRIGLYVKDLGLGAYLYLIFYEFFFVLWQMKSFKYMKATHFYKAASFEAKFFMSCSSWFIGGALAATLGAIVYNFLNTNSFLILGKVKGHQSKMAICKEASKA